MHSNVSFQRPPLVPTQADPVPNADVQPRPLYVSNDELRRTWGSVAATLDLREGNDVKLFGDFAMRIIQGEPEEAVPRPNPDLGTVPKRAVAVLDCRGPETHRAAAQLLQKFRRAWKGSNPDVDELKDPGVLAMPGRLVGFYGVLHGFVASFNTLAACIKHLNIDASDMEISSSAASGLLATLQEALFGDYAREAPDVPTKSLLPYLSMVHLHGSPTFSTRFPAELQQSMLHFGRGPHECPQLMVHVWSAEFNDPDTKYPFARKLEEMQARLDTRLAFMSKYAACLTHLPAASILTTLHQMNLELVMNAKWNQPLDGDRCGERIRLLMACGSLLAKLAPQHAMAAPESWRPMVRTLCRHVASELMQLFIVAERTKKVDWGVDDESYGQTKVPLKEAAAEIESALACALSWRLADEAQMCLDWVESASNHARGEIANVFEDMQQRCHKLTEIALADVPHPQEELNKLKEKGFAIRLTGSWRDGYAIQYQDDTRFDAQEHAGAVINYVRARLVDLEGSRFSIAGTQPLLDLLLDHLHELGEDDRATLLALISPMLQRLDMLARHQIGDMYRTDLAANTTLRLLQAKLLLEIDKRLSQADANARTAAENWLAERKSGLFTQLHREVVDGVLNQDGKDDMEIEPNVTLAPPVLGNLFEPLLKTAIDFFSAAGPARAQEAHAEAMRFLKACAGSNAELRLAVFRCERAPLKLDPTLRSTEVSALLELAEETAAENPEPTGRLLLAVLDFVVECVAHAKENDGDETIEATMRWAEQTISGSSDSLSAIQSIHPNALHWAPMATSQLKLDEEMNLKDIFQLLRKLDTIDQPCVTLMKAVMDQVLDNSELTELARLFTMSAELAKAYDVIPGKTPWLTADMLRTCLESCIDVLDEVDDEAQRAQALKLFDEVFRELQPRHAKSVVDACRSLGSRNHLEGWKLCLHCARLLGPGADRNKFLTAAFATALSPEPADQDEGTADQDEDMEAIGLWMHTDELHGLAGDDAREFRNLMDWR